jgi:hypothetical protein
MHKQASIEDAPISRVFDDPGHRVHWYEACVSTSYSEQNPTSHAEHRDAFVCWLLSFRTRPPRRLSGALLVRGV